jgi:hypothetical protein
MYKINPENEARVMEGYAKAAKTKRKPIAAGCGRKFPRFGGSLSTHDYVREYYQLNAPGAYCFDEESPEYFYPRVNIGKHLSKAVNAALDMFEPLSTRVSVPQGFDSVEVEA